jgi:putative ATP-dependent endonuclease of OLD family
MRVVALHIAGFRGWPDLALKPAGHLLVAGEPRAGRSDLIEALRRVLDPELTRNAPDEFDVFQPGPTVAGQDAIPSGGETPDEDGARDAVRDALIEVTLGDLGDDLEQHFYRRLELWDRQAGQLVAESAPGEIDRDRHALVLRLCYRLSWNPGEGTGEHWVDYPKTSLPEDGVFDRARRADRMLLPFAAITLGRPLTLQPDGRFRALLADAGGDLGKTLDALLVAVDTATDGLSAAEGVRQALAEVMEPVRPTLDIAPGDPVEDLVQFRAEGGTVAGLLRALQPTLQMDGTGPHLPLRRHGSTTGAVLAAAEAMTTARRADAVVVADDFGDRLDAGAAEYLAGELRGACAQLWLSTRRPETARAFPVTEVARVTRHRGRRQVHQVSPPADRGELSALRQLHMQLLPAISARTVAVLEGPHDVAALTAVCDRFARQGGIPVPAAHGVRLVAASFGAGGHGAVPKVCKLARQLGFRVIAALDFDEPGAGADLSFATAKDTADEVVRLPEGFAIELALVHGIPLDVLREVMTALNSTWQLNLQGLDTADEKKLQVNTVKALKQKSGLHAQYVELLPLSSPPPVAVDLLGAITELACGTRQGPWTLRV